MILLQMSVVLRLRKTCLDGCNNHSGQSLILRHCASARVLECHSSTESCLSHSPPNTPWQCGKTPGEDFPLSSPTGAVFLGLSQECMSFPPTPTPTPAEFSHTYLPIPISLFALQQSTAQLCRKQVHVDPLCGVSINGLWGGAGGGAEIRIQRPVNMPCLPHLLPSPTRTSGAWTYQRRTLRLHIRRTGPALRLL